MYMANTINVKNKGIFRVDQILQCSPHGSSDVQTAEAALVGICCHVHGARIDFWVTRNGKDIETVVLHSTSS